MKYFMGIDVSTTRSKALIINSDGSVIGVQSSPHAQSNPQPLWSEQDPEDWWRATVNSIHAVLAQTDIQPGDITAVGLTGQMHGLVLLDVNGKVLRPAILWNDQRTQAQCDEIHTIFGKEAFIAICGNVALPGFTAPKILWVAENETDVYRKARQVLLPKDYVRYRLTGVYAMDKADAAGTILFDLKKRDWSPEILAGLKIPLEWMPPTFEGPEFTGAIIREAADSTGLKVGTNVAAGGGDQAAQAVGVGAVEPGIIGLTVGTSGVVFASTTTAMIEPEGKLHAFCHAVPGTWHFMGVMLSAAGSLQWYRDTLSPQASFEELMDSAAGVGAGCEGLQFLPYLSGERTPYPDPLARGAFIGLTIRHTQAHMTRSVLEGVSFGLKDMFTLIQNTGLKEITQVRASGGGTKSALWRGILASVLGCELVTVNTAEGAAFGAALLAGVGSGAWPNVISACKDTIKITGKTQPNPADMKVYRDSYPIYRDLYPSLKSDFVRMSS